MSQPLNQPNSATADQQALADCGETVINQWLEKLEAQWEPTGAALRQIVQQATAEYQPAVLSELVRVDIDRQYQQGYSVDLNRYFDMYPVLAVNDKAAAEIAFEDYRARRTRGLDCSPSRWSKLAGVSEQLWYRQLRADANRKASAATPQKKTGALPQKIALTSQSLGASSENSILSASLERVHSARFSWRPSRRWDLVT